MKIKEFLSEEEMNKCMHWGILYSIDDLEVAIAKHYPEMELKDFLLFRILMELKDMNERENERNE